MAVARAAAAVKGGLDELVARAVPGGRIERVRSLGPDTGGEKAQGYGRPLRIDVSGGRVLVFRTATPNAYGHDRRSDRAAEMLLAYDSFGDMPDHVRALDVGAIAGGQLVSLSEAGELYLLTTFAEGKPYAEQLRAVAEARVASACDVVRCESLARWLVKLHSVKPDEPAAYTRAVRDLLGSGEGVFGIVDGYGRDVPQATPARLHALEERCLGFRWRLRGREARLSRTHGDFHPFNVVFDGDRFTLLDASRGCKGDPADDVSAMAVNFVFFAIDRREAWPDGLGVLWRRFWHVYLRESGDGELLEVLAPWLAWRALVVCSPRFYPRLSAQGRDAILQLAERALDAPRFDPDWAEELFR